MVTTFGLCWWWWLCWTWCRRWWWWRPPVKDCGHIARVVVPLEAVLSRVPHPRLCNKYIWHGCHTRYIHIFPNALYDVIAYIFDSILQKKNIFLRLCSNNFWLYMRFTQFIKYWKSGNVWQSVQCTDMEAWAGPRWQLWDREEWRQSEAELKWRLAQM